jgi:hypothetical protein
MQGATTTLDVTNAVREAVERARAGNGLMRVGEAAQIIIAEHRLDPLRQPELVDALCRQCIRYGVSIEFQRQQGRQP